MSVRAVIKSFVVSICCGLALASGASAQVAGAPAGATVPTMPPAIGAPPVGAAGAPAPTPETPDVSYLLGPDDVVEIEVLGRADYRTRARVGADGKIQVPFLGDVEASNRTARQLGEQIARALEAGGYFARPVMRVEIVGYASRYVVVLGAVGSPGLIPTNRAYRLSEIVARVGGIRGDGADHIIITSANGPERRILVKSMATGGAAEDPYVAAGDKIYVPTAEVFYMSGQINAPGAYPVNSDMTFRTAIARAGGLTEMGTDRRIKVTRGGQKLNKVDLDSKVQAGDIVVIGERLF